MKQILSLLERYASEHGKERQSTLGEFMDFLIEAFDLDKIVRADGIEARLNQPEVQNHPLLMGLKHFVVKSNEIISKDGCVDYFGSLYEEWFQTKSKADKLGQFFTPMCVSDVMSKIMLNENNYGKTCYEPTCGSGRNILSLWKYTKHDRAMKFFCSDIDASSVKMCALNMMINSMFGYVICQNTLLLDFRFGYAINELDYPLESGVCSIRPICKEEYLRVFGQYGFREAETPKPVVQKSLFDL